MDMISHPSFIKLTLILFSSKLFEDETIGDASPFLARISNRLGTQQQFCLPAVIEPYFDRLEEMLLYLDIPDVKPLKGF